RNGGKTPHVVNLDIKPPRNPDHASLWRKGDILNMADLESAFEEVRPDYVFHLAARTDLEGSSIADYIANTDGVANMIAAAKGYGACRKVVFASSMLVCRIGY